MVIIDAVIEPISETKYRITVASTDGKELLKEIFKKGLTLCPRSEPVFNGRSRTDPKQLSISLIPGAVSC